MSDLVSVVRRHEEAALAALAAATGGVALCRADGSGPRSVKSSEGAASALAEVRRELRSRGRDGSGESARLVVSQARARWAGTAERHAQSGPAWRDYAAGGLEALADLDADLARDEGDDGAERRDPATPPAPVTTPASDPVALSVAGRVAGSAQAGVARLASTRTRLAAGVLFVGLLVTVGVTAGWRPLEQPVWSALTLAAIALSAAALATFVPQPGHGWRPPVGCAPCAAAGWVLAVAGPWLAIATAPQGHRAALGLALAGAALARRLTEPQTCATPFAR